MSVEQAAVAPGTGDFAKVFRQFLDHVYNVWGHVVTNPEATAIREYFERNNFSFTHGPHYDRCRVALVKQGKLPEFLLTEDEVLAERLEHSDLGSRAAKVEFAQESRRLHDGA
jgi:hypothetical protein